MHPRELDNLSRSDLIEKAESLGVDRASLLTRAELADEIVRRTVEDPVERGIARGLLGIARDLVARVVERGLHLPDAAALIRGLARPSIAPAKPPIATVTLAEIYAAQGHRGRALAVLDEVLEKEDDHEAARVLRDRIAASPPEEPAKSPEPEPAAAVPDEQTDATSSANGSGGESSGNGARPEKKAAEHAGGPLDMLDDAPLPEEYDVDEVVLMPVDPKTVFIYWEVRPSTLEEARKRSENGRLVVRVVAVTASWDGPRVETRDIEVDDRVGDWFVRDLPPGAVLRAAIGWRAASLFEPLSVAMALAAPPDRPAAVGASELAHFTQEEGAVALAVGERDDRLAIATERARRRVAADAADETAGSSSWPAIGPSPWSGDLLAARPEAAS